jgi:diguanylate cyclase (GGDEF)-like protein/putative nucleotidyltransferase with HDIG domain
VPARLSLKTTVIATFGLLLVTSLLQGALVISSATHSAEQVRTLERQGLAPVVGLSILSQDLDQERALLEFDRATLKADQAQAIVDELEGLDSSISRTARQSLNADVLPGWNVAWADFLHARTPFLAQLDARPGPPLPPVVRRQLSDRLDLVLDLVQSDAGVDLNHGELLYAATLGSDSNALRMVVLSFVLSIALGLVFAFRLSSRLARGLGDLCVTAGLVADGAVAARADERGDDEIAQLATAINRMKDALLSAELRAGTDALTGIPNHRAVITALDLELERAQRYGRPCALLFFDLDHFKALNDGYGHVAGDAVLCAFAQVVRSSLRGVDTFGRWGGEEFVALLPELGCAEAQIVAERVRAKVAAHSFMISGGAHLTCSIGVAAYPADAQDRVALLAAADDAMYAAKHLGRNQTRTAIDPAVLALGHRRARGSSREESFMIGTIEALAALVDARDQYTGRHTMEVAALCRQLALALGLDASQAKMIERAARLHDVGKVAIPDALLQKPGRLTEEEWTVMRTHPSVGADIIKLIPDLQVIEPLIRAHHEWWDGTGYPDALAGEKIPLGARIIAVADAFTVMTTGRPYREAREVEWALREIRRATGTQFDPAVVDAFERLVATSPALSWQSEAG